MEKGIDGWIEGTHSHFGKHIANICNEIAVSYDTEVEIVLSGVSMVAFAEDNNVLGFEQTQNVVLRRRVLQVKELDIVSYLGAGSLGLS